MRRAWDEVTGDDVVKISADLGDVGLVATGG
jgi:hypothetical protein